jgi:hypothetical protein
MRRAIPAAYVVCGSHRRIPASMTAGSWKRE